MDNMIKITLPIGTTDFSIALPVLSLSTPSQRLIVAKQELALRLEEFQLNLDRTLAAFRCVSELTEAVKGGQQ